MAEALSSALRAARRALAPRKRYTGGISSSDITQPDASSMRALASVRAAPPSLDLAKFAEEPPWGARVYLAMYEQSERQRSELAIAEAKATRPILEKQGKGVSVGKRVVFEQVRRCGRPCAGDGGRMGWVR